jgi:hypothetical protein
MESADKQPRFGQFTLIGLLAYVTLIAVSLAAFRTGFVAKWPGDKWWVFVLVGSLLLGAGVSVAIATILRPRDRWVSAVLGAFQLLVVVTGGIAIHLLFW